VDGATQKDKVRLVAALAVVGRKMHRPRKSKTKKSKTQTKKPHDAKRLPQLAASFIYRCDHSMSPVGTKRTCRADLSMSVDGVERKSSVRGQTDAIDPERTSSPTPSSRNVPVS